MPRLRAVPVIPMLRSLGQGIGVFHSHGNEIRQKRLSLLEKLVGVSFVVGYILRQVKQRHVPSTNQQTVNDHWYLEKIDLVVPRLTYHCGQQRP